MFKQECYFKEKIDNIKHVIYRLNEIGYIKKFEDYDENKTLQLLTNGDIVLSDDPHGIECDNLDMLYAICALRDDDDEYQYFVAERGDYGSGEDYEWSFKTGEYVKNCSSNRDIFWDLSLGDYKYKHLHKATLQELISHFSYKPYNIEYNGSNYGVRNTTPYTCGPAVMVEIYKDDETLAYSVCEFQDKKRVALELMCKSYLDNNNEECKAGIKKLLNEYLDY